MRLIELFNIYVRYGIERLHFLLRREGWKDNQKRVYRIYSEEGLNLRRKENKRIKSSRSRVPTNGKAFTLHECWSIDFISDALFDGKEFISKELDRWAYEEKIQLGFSRPGKPTDNNALKVLTDHYEMSECLNVNWFLSLEDVQ